jgi:hypothetical protein
MRDYREIRYDLLPEFRRKRTLPGVAPFLEAVSDFITKHNAESARRLEQGKTTGIKRVTSEDMEAFTLLLLDQKDAAVFGAMLCAFATCRVPKGVDQSEPDPEPADESQRGETK